MTEENMKALLDQFRQEAREQRHDKIVKHLDKSGGPPAELLARVDSDVKWFRVWTGALGIGATCPSQSLRQQVRDTIRGRFSELHILTAEERTLLEEMELGRQHATDGQGWCSVCEGTGIEQDDDGRWPCTESKHGEQAAGQQVYEPDLDTAEDTYER